MEGQTSGASGYDPFRVQRDVLRTMQPLRQNPAPEEELDVEHASHAPYEAWRARGIAADGSRRMAPGVVKPHELVRGPTGTINTTDHDSPVMRTLTLSRRAGSRRGFHGLATRRACRSPADVDHFRVAYISIACLVEAPQIVADRNPGESSGRSVVRACHRHGNCWRRADTDFERLKEDCCSSCATCSSCSCASCPVRPRRRGRPVKEHIGHMLRRPMRRYRLLRVCCGRSRSLIITRFGVDTS